MKEIAPKLYAVSVTVAALILIFDLYTPLGVAAGVPYVGLVLLGWWFPTDRSIIVLAVVGTVLTIVGYAMSPSGGIEWFVAFNRGLAIAVIWTTAIILKVAKANSQAEVLKNEQKFSTLIENAPIGITEVSLDGKFLSANPALAEMLGYDSPLDLMTCITDIENQLYVNPDARTEVIQSLRSKGRTITPYTELYRKDGSTIWVSEDAEIVENENGVAVRYQAFVKDDTERRNLEETQLELSTFISQAATLGKIGFWICEHENFTYPYWSDELAAIFGGSPNSTGDGPASKSWSMAHPDDKWIVQDNFQKLMYTDEAVVSEFRVISSTGEVRWLREVGSGTDFRDGKNMRSFGVCQDITEYKKNESDLREMHQFNDLILSSSPVGIFTFDQSGNCVSVNDAACDITGGTREQLFEMNFHELDTWKEDGLYDKATQCLSTGKHIQHNMHVRSSFGKKLHLDCHLAPLELDEGRSLLLMITDMTEFRKIQERIFHSSKMESLGNLAGGIAHSINNLLNPILILNEPSLNTFPEGSKEHENSTIVFEAGTRAKNLIARIMAFSRQDELELTTQDVLDVLRKAVELLQSSLSANTKLVAHLDNDAFFVSCDEVQLEAVILNIVSNAGDAFAGEPGTVTLSFTAVDKQDLDKEVVTALQMPMADTYAQVEIADDGPGIKPDVIDRIFDPFFTTKKSGEGTGLGLSVAQGVVTEHGGAITVSSVLGEGTVFRIYLPQTNDQ
ncbi:MAG: PAS domain S-box protein [Rhodospirillales bacterium]|nr:PAS domain S-box protein [Rhodospirillales bacterium]MBT4040762.1 PAS domain S-box protein [Rhodospirillales bacterium]MBT4625947.1 PAS domain S-box protein [Rhodospirillales bacterium]MBT5350698.1 PAS domain S-box protein [Rhodospirillales bacterium]MBT5522060.1 PAS domain S-box protein [Rhodospirillales bacterium]